MVSESSQAKSGPRRKLRLGMVGGGQGAFIGGVHRIAARLDGRYELVAGAFSSSAEKSKASGAELGLAAERCYGDFDEMAKREKRRKDGIDVVAMVTPNHVHFAASKAFLDRGIHVICDKPLTTTLKDARKLAELVEKSGCVFALTHNYTGYPMVRQARQMVADGVLGRIRLVQAEYAQDWLTTKLEDTGHKQAEWRNDPARSGPAGCTGDIATHAMNLAAFITGLGLESLSADLTSFVPGRRARRQCARHAALRRRGQGHAVGEPSGARQRECAADPGLWRAGWARLGAGGPELSALHALLAAAAADPPRRCRLRCGGGPGDPHPGRASGGLSRGFRHLYSDAAELISAKLEGREPDPAATLVPTVPGRCGRASSSSRRWWSRAARTAPGSGPSA